MDTDQLKRPAHWTQRHGEWCARLETLGCLHSDHKRCAKGMMWEPGQ